MFGDRQGFEDFLELYKRKREDPELQFFDFGELEGNQEHAVIVKMFNPGTKEEDKELAQQNLKMFQQRAPHTVIGNTVTQSTETAGSPPW
ncbi:hypothetical protein Y1Q_0003525 [Alligator mississippiensis]|uniref:Uncharacterized protein n=1 Tax=Alligator mississippiensis TaxID=8496 RepID=A0A151M4D3_ALLMI|nr:hypothetical protein Y1Q_0003525 [Alligator mississippiensis]